MEQLKGGIFLTAKDLSLVSGHTLKSAHREHLAIRDALGIKSKKLTIRQYCEYNQLDEQEVIQYLNNFR